MSNVDVNVKCECNHSESGLLSDFSLSIAQFKIALALHENSKNPFTSQPNPCRAIITHVLPKEHRRHGVQGLLGPGREPVDAAVVHESREVSAARAQYVPHGRHGQHDVQVVGALVHEVLPNGLPCGRHTGFVRLVTDLCSQTEDGQVL